MNCGQFKNLVFQAKDGYKKQSGKPLVKNQSSLERGGPFVILQLLHDSWEEQCFLLILQLASSVLVIPAWLMTRLDYLFESKSISLFLLGFYFFKWDQGRVWYIGTEIEFHFRLRLLFDVLDLVIGFVGFKWKMHIEDWPNFIG